MNNKCVVCDSSENKIIFNEFGVDILKCKKCDHVFSSYNQSQNYSNYFGERIEKDDHFWWKESHEKMYDDFCEKFIINKKGKLLDVGCGLGYFVKKISGYQKWTVSGYEMSESAVNYAKNKLNLKNIFCGRGEDSNFSKNYFNIITLWDVIEHIPNPNNFLLYLGSILKEDGFLFIHTPNIKIQLPKAKIKKFLFGINKKKHYLEAKDHINIYSEKTIKKVLENNGFNKIDFIHLHPIQSVSGGKSLILKFIKNLWYYFSKTLYYVAFKKINLDNLFVIVRKK